MNRFLRLLGLMALVAILPLEDAFPRGGGGRGGGRGGGARANRARGNRSQERREQQEELRRAELESRIAEARLLYAKRERKTLWNDESGERLDSMVARIVGGSLD